MSPHVTSSSPRQRLNAFHLILLASFLTVCGIGVGLSAAQSSKQDEREFEDKIPKHLPIKIKIKNPEKVKDAKNENWLQDLEIEVENRSNKPIYYLRFAVVLPDTKTENNRGLAFPIQYGRDELADYATPPESSDVPIKPGETYTFKIPANLQQGWERFVMQRGILKTEPKKVQFIFEDLNFGDGTGFTITDGVPVDIHAPPLSS